MPPTPPPDDDALDFDALTAKPGAGKSKSPESDFEKELEALFAEELASSDEKPASAPPIGAPDLDPDPAEDILQLDDLIMDAPASTASAVPAADGGDDDILDLSGFDAGGALDITPPDDLPGGKDGGIDTGALDDLISGLGEPQKAAPAQDEVPMDGAGMADLLESLDVPKSQPAPPLAADTGDDMLELSLGDLVEEMPAADPLAADEPLDLASAEPVLDLADISLPDLSDPEPGRDLVAEQEAADMGGELNLSLDDMVQEPAAQPGDLDLAPGAQALDQVLGAPDLDLDGLVEVAPAEKPAPSLDPGDLLDQIPDGGDLLAAEPVGLASLDLEPAPVQPDAVQPNVVQPDVVQADVAQPEAAPQLPLADAALGLVAVGAVAVGAAAVGAALAKPAAEPAPVSAADGSVHEQMLMANRVLADLQERFADLSTQVTGSGVALMRLEGRLAEKDKAIAELESQLAASQTESGLLRKDLEDLRGQLEETLRTREADRAEARRQADDLTQRQGDAEKASTGVKERLALVEDRQIQLDRELHAEIARAVPREAARVIREEIAALAASLREE